jgi:transcription elongation factor GreA
MPKVKKNGDVKKVFVTEKGYEKLIEELKNLQTVGRKEVASRLQEAISYGDLSENAEYDEAKNQQAFLEARINELEDQIKNAEIIKEADTKTGIVQIGSTVILQIKGGEKHEYTIVGSTEADPMLRKISNESPVGDAVLGKKTKDKVTIVAPGGKFEYEIMKVS